MDGSALNPFHILKTMDLSWILEDYFFHIREMDFHFLNVVHVLTGKDYTN